MNVVDRWELANSRGEVVKESSVRTSNDGLYWLVSPDGVIIGEYKSRAEYEAALGMRTNSRQQRVWVGQPKPSS